MENKRRVAMMMVIVMVVVMAAIGGEAQDDSCETKCAITCRDSLFHKQCLDRCLMKACKDHPPPSQLHSPVLAESPEGDQEQANEYCKLNCEKKCHDHWRVYKCYHRCVRECPP